MVPRGLRPPRFFLQFVDYFLTVFDFLAAQSHDFRIGFVFHGAFDGFQFQVYRCANVGAVERGQFYGFGFVRLCHVSVPFGYPLGIERICIVVVFSFNCNN